MLTSLVRALVAAHPESWRWPYAPALIVCGLVTLMAFDEGTLAVVQWLGTLTVCLLQMWRRTLLGWAILAMLFVAWAVSIAHTHILHPTWDSTRDYLLLQVLSAFPAIPLLIGLPRPRTHTEREALAISVVVAMLVIARYSVGGSNFRPTDADDPLSWLNLSPRSQPRADCERSARRRGATSSGSAPTSRRRGTSSR